MKLNVFIAKLVSRYEEIVFGQLGEMFPSSSSDWFYARM